MSINENREFYVYEHIRLDNMTCFYVGKGKGERAYDLARNDHHDNISNMHGHAVVIIADNLTEEEAFDLERDIIEDYVFNLGYGINIKGYDDYDHELPYLTNFTWGGEGISGMHHTEESKRKIGEKNSEAHKGKKLSEEHKRNIGKGEKGRPSPNKGKKTSEETKRKLSEKLGKKVICITTGKIFNSLREAGKHYNVAHNNILRCCKLTCKSAGKLKDGTRLQWKYLEDYNDNCLEEYKLNIGDQRNKKVICITTGENFDCIKDAAEKYKTYCTSIVHCCNGRYKHAGKLKDGTKLQWKYSEDDDNDLKVV